MLLRRLASRLTPPVAALVLVGLAATTTGCADQTAAARVGDQTLSESDLLAEVRALVENETLLDLNGLTEEQRRDLRGESEASFSQQFVGGVLTQRIQLMLFEQLFVDEGLELSDADRAAGRDAFDSQYGDAADEFPDSYRDQAVEDFGRLRVLQDQLGDGFQQAFVDLVETTDVQLSSRFGTWDPDAFLAGLTDQNATDPSIIPPPGAEPARGSADDAPA